MEKLKRSALLDSFTDELTEEGELQAKGLVDDNGELTQAGQLKLLQLKTIQWMNKYRSPEACALRAEAKAKKKAREQS